MPLKRTRATVAGASGHRIPKIPKLNHPVQDVVAECGRHENLISPTEEVTGRRSLYSYNGNDSVRQDCCLGRSATTNLVEIPLEILARIAMMLSLSAATDRDDNHAKRLSGMRRACRTLEGPATDVLYRRFAVLTSRSYSRADRLAYLVQGAYYLSQLSRSQYVRVLFVSRGYGAEHNGINWLNDRLATTSWRSKIKDKKIVDWGNQFATAQDLLDQIYDSVRRSTTLDIFDSTFWTYWLRKAGKVPNITRLCIGSYNQESQSLPNFKEVLPELRHLVLSRPGPTGPDSWKGLSQPISFDLLSQFALSPLRVLCVEHVTWDIGEQIKTMPSLRVLAIRGPLTDQHYQSVCNALQICTNLERVTIQAVEDHMKRPTVDWSRYPALRHLGGSCQYFGFERESEEYLSRLPPKLEMLEIYDACYSFDLVKGPIKNIIKACPSLRTIFFELVGSDQLECLRAVADAYGVEIRYGKQWYDSMWSVSEHAFRPPFKVHYILDGKSIDLMNNTKFTAND